MVSSGTVLNSWDSRNPSPVCIRSYSALQIQIMHVYGPSTIFTKASASCIPHSWINTHAHKHIPTGSSHATLACVTSTHHNGTHNTVSLECQGPTHAAYIAPCTYSPPPFSHACTNIIQLLCILLNHSPLYACKHTISSCTLA